MYRIKPSLVKNAVFSNNAIKKQGPAYEVIIRTNVYVFVNKHTSEVVWCGQLVETVDTPGLYATVASMYEQQQLEEQDQRRRHVAELLQQAAG